MQIAKYLHIHGWFTDAEASARFEQELRLLDELDDAGIEALRSVIGAGDSAELTRKVFRLAAISVAPELTLGRLLAQDELAFATLCIELIAYRQFMIRCAGRCAGSTESPRVIANDIERAQRQWLAALARERFGIATVDPGEQPGGQEGQPGGHGSLPGGQEGQPGGQP